MDGIHDLGGKHGYGAVVSQNQKKENQEYKDEVAFSQRWQAAVFAMLRAIGAADITQNTDQFRHAVERITPSCYLTDGYYGRWLGAIETLLVEAGELTQAQISARVEALGYAVTAPIAARPSPTPDQFLDPLQRQSTAARSTNTTPLFQVGDQVVTSSSASLGHTRLPAYARGVKGVVVSWHNSWVFPDTNAHGQGEQPQHLYTVEFDGVSLWGDLAEPNTMTLIDLFEPYLEKIA